MMEDLGAAANQALYGKRKGKVGFGKALYEIKEERRKGTNYVYEKAVFYEEVAETDQTAAPYLTSALSLMSATSC